MCGIHFLCRWWASRVAVRARHHEGVEPGPGVAEEGEEPVGEGGDNQLQGEEEREEEVELVEEPGEGFVGG